VKRGAAVVAGVSLVLVAGWWVLLRPQDLLVTADGPCYVDIHEGLLVADPTTGTALLQESEVPQGSTNVRQSGTVPLVWRPGFSGRRVGAEIEVLDRQGNVVATTGQHVMLTGGSQPSLRGWLVCGRYDDVPAFPSQG
jgi:hypothetical protein